MSSSSLQRKGLLAGGAVAAMFLVSILAAGPAAAAAPSGCAVAAATPWVQGGNTWSTSNVNCTTAIIQETGLKIQEKVLVAYVDRTGWGWHGPTGSAVKSYSWSGFTPCAGHGTDVWRGVAGGVFVGNVTALDYPGSGQSLTC
jgi:hypothetical protein